MKIRKKRLVACGVVTHWTRQPAAPLRLTGSRLMCYIEPGILPLQCLYRLAQSCQFHQSITVLPRLITLRLSRQTQLQMLLRAQMPVWPNRRVLCRPPRGLLQHWEAHPEQQLRSMMLPACTIRLRKREPVPIQALQRPAALRRVPQLVPPAVRQFRHNNRLIPQF